MVLTPFLLVIGELINLTYERPPESLPEGDRAGHTFRPPRP